MFPSTSGNTGGTDLSLFNPAFLSATTSTGSLVTFLSVNGVGILTSINGITAAGTGTLKITIDGVVVQNDATFAISTRETVFVTNWYFKRSLLIEYQSTVSNNFTLKAAYMTA